jgi:aldehyde dehydrogenase (NAD+)
VRASDRLYSDQAYEIRSPATEELVATVAKGSIEHADRAVESAKRAFESGVWSDKTPDERSKILTACRPQCGARTTSGRLTWPTG